VAQDWHLQETYKGLITLSIEALKMLALVNGGAAVALLTYLGAIAARQLPTTAIPSVQPALLSFSGGLLAVTLAFIVAYITQGQLFREQRPGGSKSGKHVYGVIVGVTLAVLSAIAFGIGCWLASTALTGDAHAS
jgi:hypothetical protein